jgi:hypothetical protein
MGNQNGKDMSHGSHGNKRSTLLSNTFSMDSDDLMSLSSTQSDTRSHSQNTKIRDRCKYEIPVLPEIIQPPERICSCRIVVSIRIVSFLLLSVYTFEEEEEEDNMSVSTSYFKIVH